MTPHPLIDRLTDEMGWPLLSNDHDLAEFTARPGVHALFLPGDIKRNLETPDVAVILPELRIAFQNQFDCAVVDDTIEAAVRDSVKVFKTPSIFFYRAGKFLGAIPKVRDWDDYMTRIAQLLAQSVAA